MKPAVASGKRSRASNARKEHDSGPGDQANGHLSINVGEAERQLSMIGGTILAVCGLMRGSVSGLGLAVLGGALIYRGHTGHCSVYEAMGHNSADGNAFSNSPEHRSKKLQQADQTSPQPS